MKGRTLEQMGHQHDQDCRPDDTGTCEDCGVVQGDECPGCGQRAFHLDDCIDVA